MYLVTISTCACWTKQSNQENYKRLIMIHNCEKREQAEKIILDIKHLFETMCVLDESHKLFIEYEILINSERRTITRDENEKNTPNDEPHESNGYLYTQPGPNAQSKTKGFSMQNLLKPRTNVMKMDKLINSIRMISTPISDLSIRRFHVNVAQIVEASKSFVILMSERDFKTFSNVMHDFLIPIEIDDQQIEENLYMKQRTSRNLTTLYDKNIEPTDEEPIYDTPKINYESLDSRSNETIQTDCASIKSIVSRTLTRI